MWFSRRKNAIELSFQKGVVDFLIKFYPPEKNDYGQMLKTRLNNNYVGYMENKKNACSAS